MNAENFKNGTMRLYVYGENKGPGFVSQSLILFLHKTSDLCYITNSYKSVLSFQEIKAPSRLIQLKPFRLLGESHILIERTFVVLMASCLPV